MSEVIELTDATFDEVLQTNETVLVKFGAPWCRPCKQVESIIEELSEQWGELVTVGKIETNINNIETVTKYGIMTVPTLILFKDGFLVKRISGRITKKHIVDAFAPFVFE